MGAASYDGDDWNDSFARNRFGPAGFLALKFRLSSKVPILLGFETSAAFHLWKIDKVDVDNRLGNVLALLSALTLSIYPSRNLYFMVGAGNSFLFWDYGRREDFDMATGAV